MLKQITIVKENIDQGFEMPWSVYPYANYVHYGLNSPLFKVFVTSNGVVVTQYDDTLQICGKEISERDVEEVIAFAKANSIRTITGSSSSIHLLSSKTSLKNKVTYGKIIEICIKNHSSAAKIALASTKKDYEEIAKFVVDINSASGSYYELNQYFNQIYNRYLEHYSRNWFIKEKESIIGHIATYAEAPSYAVLGGLVVEPNHRQHGIGKDLFCTVTSSLINEGKRVYLFCFNEMLLPFYRRYALSEDDVGKLILLHE